VHQAVVSETETKEKREENTEGSSNEEWLAWLMLTSLNILTEVEESLPHRKGEDSLVESWEEMWSSDHQDWDKNQ
jgi:uncharacterized protein YqcC (DUF446 family)